MKEFDKKLSDKIKQVLANHEPTLEQAHWLAMQKKLAQQRRVLWFKRVLIIIFLIGIGAVALWWQLKPALGTNPQLQTQEESINRKPSDLNNQKSISGEVNEEKGMVQLRENPSVLGDTIASADSESSTNRANVVPNANQPTESNTSLENEIANTEQQRITTTQKVSKDENAFNPTSKENEDVQLNNKKETKEIKTLNTLSVTQEEKSDPSNLKETSNPKNEDEKTSLSNLLLLEKLPYKPIEFAIPQGNINIVLPTVPVKQELPQTAPEGKWQLGFLGGASLLEFDGHKGLGSSFTLQSSYSLNKRLFIQLALGVNHNTIETDQSAYVPVPVPAPVPDSIPSIAFPSDIDEPFSIQEFQPQPLAYTLPSYNATLSFGYRFYTSNRLNLFATLGTTQTIWGKVSVAPYTDNSQLEFGYISISSNAPVERAAEEYPRTHAAFTHSDIFRRWQFQLGGQYQLAKKLNATLVLSTEQNTGVLSPEELNLNNYAVQLGLSYTFKK